MDDRQQEQQGLEEEIELRAEGRIIQVAQVGILCPCGTNNTTTDPRAAQRYDQGAWIQGRCQKCGQRFRARRQLVQLANSMPNRAVRRAGLTRVK